MPFVYDSETFSIIDEARDIVVKPGAGREDHGACQYHIFHDGCEYVCSTWTDERDIHYAFSKEKGPDGRRARIVTLGDKPAFNLRSTKVSVIEGERPWDRTLEDMFREAIYFKQMRRVGKENIDKISVSFSTGLARGSEEYPPKSRTDAEKGEGQ